MLNKLNDRSVALDGHHSNTAEHSMSQLFRNILREATANAHRSLDHHPILSPLLRSPLSTEDYIVALRALHGPQYVLESLLHGFAPSEAFLGRSADLERDLQRFDAKPFPVVVTLPSATNDAAKIGAMYVIEGSNLGGQVIARQLAQTLPPELPRDFFGRAEGYPRWERFWEFAMQYLSPENIASASEMAVEVFVFYRAHLDSVLHTPHTS